MLDRNGREMRVRNKVAYGLCVAQHSGKYHQVRSGGADHANDRQIEPFLDVSERVIYGQWLRSNTWIRGETDECAQHRPWQRHRLNARERVVEPIPRTGVAG